MNIPKRRGRGWLLWLGLVVVVISVLITIGFVYESLSEASDARAYPPPGQMIDVGGYSLHINSMGTGNPTVVIDAGLGDWSTMWAWVQPEVAKITRVCTYDRAGSGWSEPGLLPRNAEQYAKELHTLLHKANIQGPYVLVGHSLGGLPVRVFVHLYPSEVAGVVLIESMSPAQFTQSSNTARSQTASKSHSFTVLPALARAGAVRLAAKPLGLVPHLPEEVKNAYLSRLVLPTFLQAMTDEAQGMPESGEQAGAVKTFGDLPLIVLTSGLNNTPAGWQSWQKELLQLSSNSRQVIANNSGHNIEIDQPDAAVAAIGQMVEKVR